MRLRVSKAALLVTASMLLAASLAGCSANSRAQGGGAGSEAGDVRRQPGETPKTEASKAEAPKVETQKTEASAANDVSPSASDSSTRGAGASTPAAEARVVIEDFAFSPDSLTVAAGTRVTWVNRDTAPHTATDTDKRFNSGALDTGDEFSFVFKDRGDYAYYCALHPQMRGRITVK
jgi:plastocyanin